MMMDRLRRSLLSTAALVVASVCIALPLPAQNDEKKDGDSGLVGRDPLRERIADAIRKGSGYLYGAAGAIPSGGAYPLGNRALVAYALLESGTSPRSPVIVRLFEEMEELPLREVYSVSIYAMALDAWLRKEPQREGARASQTGKKDPRFQKMVSCLDWLVKARLWKRGVWGYDRIGRGVSKLNLWVDFSNSQFAVLALQVGLRNELEVPHEVLEEIAAAHIDEAQPVARGTGRILCEGGGWWTDSQEPPKNSDRERTVVAQQPVIFTANGFALQGIAKGWAYRPAYNRPEREQGRPTYSMTAAAVSSLIVAREGLARAQKLDASQQQAIDRTIAEGVLTLKRDFESLFPDTFQNLLRNYYYTLYSFEKAMDLGGIVTMSGIDWYREQSRILIGEQRRDGAWGSEGRRVDPAFDRVSTAFALLFLCRATRNLRIEPPDPVITSAEDGSKEESGVHTGRVYLPSQQGMVRLDELFGMLADVRTTDLIELAKEIVGSVPPGEVPELLPYIAEVRNDSRDAVDAFARRTIEDVTGLAGRSPKRDIDAWLDRWRQLRGWGEARDLARRGAIEKQLADGGNTPLALTAIECLLQLGSVESVPVLLDALEASSSKVRARAHRALETLTLTRVEFDPVGAADVRERSVIRWRDVWSRNGKELIFREKWGRLRKELEKAADGRERARVRAAIVALGPICLPEVEAILAADSYAFDWVLIRESLTGERRGL